MVIDVNSATMRKNRLGDMERLNQSALSFHKARLTAQHAIEETIQISDYLLARHIAEVIQRAQEVANGIIEDAKSKADEESRKIGNKVELAVIQEANIIMAQARQQIERATLSLLEAVNSERDKIEALATTIRDF